MKKEKLEKEILKLLEKEIENIETAKDIAAAKGNINEVERLQRCKQW